MSENSWDTHCHLVEGWDTNNCCSSCHDDAYEFGIEPCSFEENGKTYFVCCKCKTWHNKKIGCDPLVEFLKWQKKIGEI